VHLLKLDKRSDDDYCQHEQQTQLRTKHYEVGQFFIVAEHEIAADSDQGQRREEQTTKQTFVRLNNQFLVVHCSSHCQTIHCTSASHVYVTKPQNFSIQNGTANGSHILETTFLAVSPERSVR